MKRGTKALLLAMLAACSPVRRGAEGGPIARGSVRNSERDGQWTMFLPDGQRLTTGAFEAGAPHGTWKMFHPDGSLRERAEFVRGVREGPAATFHANARLESRGDYVAGACDGAWEWYLPDGAVDAARTGHYRAGARIE